MVFECVDCGCDLFRSNAKAAHAVLLWEMERGTMRLQDTYHIEGILHPKTKHR